MNDDDTPSASRHASLQTLNKPEYYAHLSIPAKVEVGADLIRGRVPRFHECMTLKDAVLITGLPEAEAKRRIQAMQRSGNPGEYAALYLIEGCGEKYRAGQNDAPGPEDVGEPPVLRPLWANSHRAGPNAIFRSALFPVLKFQENRPFVKKQKIFSVEGITVLFTGEQFDQADLDVYLELLHMAAEQPLGTDITFSAHSLLLALGRNTGLSDHQWLNRALIRLRGGTVEITDHNIRYFGGLIEGGIQHEVTKHYTISINPKFAAFFMGGLWSKIDHEQRDAFGRNMTAKALHAYYSTHAAPGPHSFDTLAGIAGLAGKNRRDVKARLIDVHETMKKEGFLLDFQVLENAIQVTLHPSPSQARYLAKQAAPKKTGSPKKPSKK